MPASTAPQAPPAQPAPPAQAQEPPAQGSAPSVQGQGPPAQGPAPSAQGQEPPAQGPATSAQGQEPPTQKPATSAQAQEPPTQKPATSAQAQEPTAREPAPQRSRGADTRALTQVLFGELKCLTPGTPEHDRVRAALIEANLPLVRYAAARFRSRNEPMEDVVQVGTIGLINAIDRFDPERGVQFPTFAMPTVVGEIKRYFRDNVRTVHVPRRLHELWVQVNSATEDLTTAFGRSPTTAEIAERLRITEEEVLSCIEAGRSYHATSLEAAQEGDGLPGLLDRLGYEDPALDGVEHRDLVRHLLVQLPEREQRILLLRYYSNLTQSQISAELGVSQMHVSRLLARSFQRLRSSNRIEA
ncbi:SigB/SigF/SigG family RNA polymerase sigma factor [Streptomyces sp. NPDC097107]|uniref:SigB/SigF/SigG family RNA polymerase sigma factor n=1 Tax=Streptomyces sp. NPDC097107 TaxID=3366089 RepID=UPI0037F8F2CF